MSTAKQIAYLNQVKTNNSSQITANTATIAGIESLNSDLSAQIASNETQITVFEAANTELVDNLCNFLEMIDINKQLLDIAFANQAAMGIIKVNQNTIWAFLRNIKDKYGDRMLRINGRTEKVSVFEKETMNYISTISKVALSFVRADRGFFFFRESVGISADRPAVFPADLAIPKNSYLTSEKQYVPSLGTARDEKYLLTVIPANREYQEILFLGTDPPEFRRT